MYRKGLVDYYRHYFQALEIQNVQEGVGKLLLTSLLHVLVDRLWKYR